MLLCAVLVRIHHISVTLFRDDNTVIAKMNVLFDKAAYEKGRSLRVDVDNRIGEATEESESVDGSIVKRAIQDSLVSGKVGSLAVDPNYLDFEALECKL